MAHAQLIEALGGTGRVAGELNLSLSRVSNWKERGIPWKWRYAVAELAKKKCVRLPAGFFEPSASSRST